jgi:putative nucleotidyltransferase with HDIG domain
VDNRQALQFNFIADFGKQLDRGAIDLPSFPDVALRVRQVLRDPNCHLDTIARVITSEPVLAVRVLKIANSALLNGGGQQVTEVRNAVIRLGQNMVRNAAFAVATEQLFRGKRLSKLWPRLEMVWRHSVQVAAIAYVTARKYTAANPDEALLAGLLHDIGKLHLLNSVESHPELLQDDAALDELSALWHAELGRAILESWDMPEAICMATDNHHVLDREHPGEPDLTDIVLVANLHAHCTDGADRCAGLAWEALPAVRRLGMDQESKEEVLAQSMDEIHALAQTLAGG